MTGYELASLRTENEDLKKEVGTKIKWVKSLSKKNAKLTRELRVLNSRLNKYEKWLEEKAKEEGGEDEEFEFQACLEKFQDARKGEPKHGSRNPQRTL